MTSVARNVHIPDAPTPCPDAAGGDAATAAGA
jgi:hypothetical protein